MTIGAGTIPYSCSSAASPRDTHMEAATLSLSRCGTCGYGYLFVCPDQVFPPPFQHSLETTIHYLYGYRSPPAPGYATVKANQTEGQAPFDCSTLAVSASRRQGTLVASPAHLVSPRSTPSSQTTSIVQRKTVTRPASRKSEPLEGYCDFHCRWRNNPVETLLSSDDMIRESSARSSFRT